MWSPAFTSASTVLVIAAMPDENTSAASVPSNSAIAFSTTVWVGLP